MCCGTQAYKTAQKQPCSDERSTGWRVSQPWACTLAPQPDYCILCVWPGIYKVTVTVLTTGGHSRNQSSCCLQSPQLQSGTAPVLMPPKHMKDFFMMFSLIRQLWLDGCHVGVQHMKWIHFIERSKKYYFSSFPPYFRSQASQHCTFLFQVTFFLFFHCGQGGKGILSFLHLH